MRPNGGGTITTLNTGTSLTLTESHVGMQIRLQDMASNSQGSTAWAGAAWLGPVAAAPVGPTLKAGTVTNPGLGILPNWDGPDRVNANPFLDWLKLGTEWQTSGATSMNWAALQSAGHISPTGSLLSIPAGADNITMQVLQRMPAGVGAVSGRYRLYFTGDGGISLGGAGSVDWPAVGQAEFNYTANGDSYVNITVDRIDTPSLTFNALVHEDDWAAYEAGDFFRAEWLDLIRNLRVLRFTDWMGVDYYGGPGTWANRNTKARLTYQSGEGVPVEVMCELCNEIGADPWFSLVSNADNNYVTQFATVALAQLGSNRQVYVELSNKAWDSMNGPTYGHFRDLALAAWGDDNITNVMEMYGGRSSEVFAAWRAVWSGANASRVRTVLQGWTPNTYVSDAALMAPNWIALQSGRQAPYLSATDYALHCNLDGGIRYEWLGFTTNTDTVQGWIDTLSGSELYDRIADAMRSRQPGIEEGYTLADLTTAWNAQKTLLTSRGNLNPLCYEAGWHCAIPPSKQANSAWYSMMHGFALSPQAATVQDEAIAAWYSAFGPSSPYMRKNDIRLPDQNNIYGLLRWPGDTSGNLQLAAAVAQIASRTGQTGRGSDAFIGNYDVVPGGS